MKLHEKIVDIIEKYLGKRIADHEEAVAKCRKYLSNVGLKYVDELRLKNLLSLVITYHGDNPTDVISSISNVYDKGDPNRLRKSAGDPFLYPKKNKIHRKYFDKISDAAKDVDHKAKIQFNKAGLSVKKGRRTKIRLDRAWLMDDKHLVCNMLLYVPTDMKMFKKKLPEKIVRSRAIGWLSDEEAQILITNIPEMEIVDMITKIYLGLGEKDDFE